MVTADTIISGSSAKKVESSDPVTPGRWGRMVLLGNFTFGDQNHKYIFKNMKDALNILGDEPQSSGSKGIRAAFNAADPESGNLGITELMCIPTRKATSAKIIINGRFIETTPETIETEEGEEPVEPSAEPDTNDPVPVLSIETLEGSKGNNFTFTMLDGTYTDYKIIIRNAGRRVFKRDNVTIANFMKLASKNPLLKISLADGINPEDLDNMVFEEVIEEAFTGGSEEVATVEDLFQAMELVKDETFARLCFTDMLDEGFFEAAMDYGEMKFELNNGSSIYFAIDPDLELTEKMDIFTNTPSSTIVYTHQTINELSPAETAISYAGLCSGVKVGESVAYGEISWINRVYPEYTRDEYVALANAGGTSFKVSNSSLNTYKVARGMTASQELDKSGRKTAECFQHGVDTLHYLQSYLDADTYLNMTGVARTVDAVDTWENDRVQKALEMDIASAIQYKLQVDKENPSIFTLSFKAEVNRELEWIEYQYSIDLENYKETEE